MRMPDLAKKCVGLSQNYFDFLENKRINLLYGNMYFFAAGIFCRQ